MSGVERRVVQLLTATGRLLGWLAMAAVLVTALASPGSPLSLRHVAAEAPPIVISGSIAGLVPGATGALTLTLTSAADADLVVHEVRVDVTGVSGCTADALQVQSWTGELVVPAHGAATAQLPIGLAQGVDCPQATWQLRYTSS